MIAEAYTEPSIKIDNTRNTLETPVWRKPAKMSFYYGISREFIATENQKFLTKISLASFLTPLAKTAQQTQSFFRPRFFNLLSAHLFRLCFFQPRKIGPTFLALKNRPSDGCCMWPKFDLPLLHNTAQVWPLLAAQI
jgi:hypothetical protein